jgi:hypothetical protein
MFLLPFPILFAYSIGDFLKETGFPEIALTCLLFSIFGLTFCFSVIASIVGIIDVFNGNFGAIATIIPLATSIWICLTFLPYMIETVDHRLEVRLEAKEEKTREGDEARLKAEEAKSRERDEAFAYASEELKSFVVALGGKALGCSNYASDGDFLPCSLATEKGMILEVKCPSLQGVHGCLLTDKAYEVLSSRGFDVNIGNTNSNSNSNLQKSD